MMSPSDLTLRDYIAIHAMQGLMTLHPDELAKMQHDIDQTLSALVARIAYKVADEMMKERTNDYQNAKTESGKTKGDDEKSTGGNQETDNGIDS